MSRPLSLFLAAAACLFPACGSGKLPDTATLKVWQEEGEKEVAKQREADKARAEHWDQYSPPKADRKPSDDPDELDAGGLVVLKKSVRAGGGEITGTVVNRRGKRLAYAEIRFGLFDASGGRVGTAIANVSGLEAGDRWNFRATTFGTDFDTWKFSELTGY